MKHLFCILAIVAAGHGSVLLANNIAVSNAVTTGQNTSAGTNAAANYTLVEFDLSWANSWRASTGPSNWDAAWVFVKFMVGVSNPSFSNVTLTNATNTVTLTSVANLRVGMPVRITTGSSTLTAGTVITAINPITNVVTLSNNATTTASNNALEFIRIWEHASLDATAGNHTAPASSTIDPASDGTGVFIYRNGNGTGTFNLSDVQLRWVYGANGVRDDAVLQLKVFAIEMVSVPQGSFYLGSGGTESGSFTNGSWTSGNTIPFQITSESALGIDNAAGKLWGTSSSGNNTIGNAVADAEATLAAAFPKGYAGFYCMKYEISQGDYRDFLNTLTYNQQANRTAVAPNSSAGTGALSNSQRNGLDIQTPGNPTTLLAAVYACNLDGDGNYNEADDGEWIACNFLTWMDGCAYVDWAGLRPMTELEYEKACRGDQAAVSGEHAWGSASITGATGISNGGANNETFSNLGANCVDNSGVGGPLRVGAFAGGATTRAQSGASYYGIMELSGNLWERPVNIGHANGRDFTGLNGNGQLSANGHANQSLWPGNISNEVTGANGSGFRGGSFYYSAPAARVSDRQYAANAYTSRFNHLGFRGVRVFP